MTTKSAPSSADRPKARKTTAKKRSGPARASKEADKIRRLTKAQLQPEERIALALASLDRCVLWAAELAEGRSTTGAFCAVDLAAKWAALARSLGELQSASGPAAGRMVVIVPGFGPGEIETGGPRETGTDAA